MPTSNSTIQSRQNEITVSGVETNFGVGVGEASRERGICGSALSSLSGVRGGAPATEGFSCSLSRQITFPSISVRVAYGLHG